jgi:hypothetical protein
MIVFMAGTTAVKAGTAGVCFWREPRRRRQGRHIFLFGGEHGGRGGDGNYFVLGGHHGGGGADGMIVFLARTTAAKAGTACVFFFWRGPRRRRRGR